MFKITTSPYKVQFLLNFLNIYLSSSVQPNELKNTNIESSTNKQQPFSSKPTNESKPKQKLYFVETKLRNCDNVVTTFYRDFQSHHCKERKFACFQKFCEAKFKAAPFNIKIEYNTWMTNCTSCLKPFLNLKDPQSQYPFTTNPLDKQGGALIFVIVSFIVLMLIVIAWLLSYYIQRFRQQRLHVRIYKTRQQLARKAMSRIPVRILKEEDLIGGQPIKNIKIESENLLNFDKTRTKTQTSFLYNDTSCAICIEQHVVNDTVRILPCKHIFHKKCVDPWLFERQTCPICKMDILKAVGFSQNFEFSPIMNEVYIDRTINPQPNNWQINYPTAIPDPQPPPNQILPPILESEETIGNINIKLVTNESSNLINDNLNNQISNSSSPSNTSLPNEEGQVDSIFNVGAERD